MNIRKDPRSTRPGKMAKKWLWSARRFFLRMGDGQKCLKIWSVWLDITRITGVISWIYLDISRSRWVGKHGT